MVRKMTPADAPALKTICEAALGHKSDSSLIAERISELPDYYYLAVCESGDTVCGFIQAERYDLLYGGQGWNIIALAVVPEMQGNGFGKELVSSLENYARKHGADFVRLNCRADREAAHAFYSRLGYTCDKTQKRFIKYF